MLSLTEAVLLLALMAVTSSIILQQRINGYKITPDVEANINMTIATAYGTYKQDLLANAQYISERLTQLYPPGPPSPTTKKWDVIIITNTSDLAIDLEVGFSFVYDTPNDWTAFWTNTNEKEPGWTYLMFLSNPAGVPYKNFTGPANIQTFSDEEMGAIKYIFYSAAKAGGGLMNMASTIRRNMIEYFSNVHCNVMIVDQRLRRTFVVNTSPFAWAMVPDSKSNSLAYLVWR